MSNKYYIYGERNSGTNYLSKLIELNYNMSLYSNNSDKEFSLNSWKHCLIEFDKSYRNSELYIFYISREIYSWLVSMYKKPYHIISNYNNFFEFISNEFVSDHYYDNGIRYVDSYRNIISLYNIKCRRYLEELPKTFFNYQHIRYEDLLESDGLSLSESMYNIYNIGCREFSNYQSNAVMHINNESDNFSNKLEYYLNNSYMDYYNSKIIEYVNQELDKELYSKLGYKLI